jgi:SAM-dependent methyltransferase
MKAQNRLYPPFWDREYWALCVLRSFVREALNTGIRGRALDYGAGDSPYRPLFERAGVDLIGADIGPSPSASLQIDEQGRVPVPGGYFDVVLSTQVLEHVTDVQQYLREAYRVLRPGGMCLISTHGTYMLHRHPVDLRRWTVDGLRLELEQAGFEVSSMVPRIGILATTTHHRAFIYGGLLKRSILTSWLRPILFFWLNCLMAVEDWVTPVDMMEILPELLLAKCFKPK